MPIRRENGFAMLEVLVSMLVIMIGVLGIAGLQMLAVNNTETARYQNTATMLASSIVAEMQANSAYWGQILVPPAQVYVNGTTITSQPANLFTGPATTCSNVVAPYCSATQLAYYDLQNWGAAMAGVANVDGVTLNGMALPPPTPGPSGNINCIATTPMTCTITIYWSEKNIALTNATGAESGVFAAGTSQNHSYQTTATILVYKR